MDEHHQPVEAGDQQQADSKPSEITSSVPDKVPKSQIDEGNPSLSGRNDTGSKEQAAKQNDSADGVTPSKDTDLAPASQVPAGQTTSPLEGSKRARTESKQQSDAQPTAEPSTSKPREKPPKSDKDKSDRKRSRDPSADSPRSRSRRAPRHSPDSRVDEGRPNDEALRDRGWVPRGRGAGPLGMRGRRGRGRGGPDGPPGPWQGGRGPWRSPGRSSRGGMRGRGGPFMHGAGHDYPEDWQDDHWQPASSDPDVRMHIDERENSRSPGGNQSRLREDLHNTPRRDNIDAMRGPANREDRRIDRPERAGPSSMAFRDNRDAVWPAGQGGMSQQQSLDRQNSGLRDWSADRPAVLEREAPSRVQLSEDRRELYVVMQVGGRDAVRRATDDERRLFALRDDAEARADADGGRIRTRDTRQAPDEREPHMIVRRRGSREVSPDWDRGQQHFAADRGRELQHFSPRRQRMSEPGDQRILEPRLKASDLADRALQRRLNEQDEQRPRLLLREDGRAREGNDMRMQGGDMRFGERGIVREPDMMRGRSPVHVRRQSQDVDDERRGMLQHADSMNADHRGPLEGPRQFQQGGRSRLGEMHMHEGRIRRQDSGMDRPQEFLRQDGGVDRDRDARGTRQDEGMDRDRDVRGMRQNGGMDRDRDVRGMRQEGGMDRDRDVRGMREDNNWRRDEMRPMSRAGRGGPETASENGPQGRRPSQNGGIRPELPPGFDVTRQERRRSREQVPQDGPANRDSRDGALAERPPKHRADSRERESARSRTVPPQEGPKDRERAGRETHDGRREERGREERRYAEDRGQRDPAAASSKAQRGSEELAPSGAPSSNHRPRSRSPVAGSRARSGKEREAREPEGRERARAQDADKTAGRPPKDREHRRARDEGTGDQSSRRRGGEEQQQQPEERPRTRAEVAQPTSPKNAAPTGSVQTTPAMAGDGSAAEAGRQLMQALPSFTGNQLVMLPSGQLASLSAADMMALTGAGMQLPGGQGGLPPMLLVNNGMVTPLSLPGQMMQAGSGQLPGTFSLAAAASQLSHPQANALSVPGAAAGGMMSTLLQAQQGGLQSNAASIQQMLSAQNAAQLVGLMQPPAAGTAQPVALQQQNAANRQPRISNGSQGQQQLPAAGDMQQFSLAALQGQLAGRGVGQGSAGLQQPGLALSLGQQGGMQLVQMSLPTGGLGQQAGGALEQTSMHPLLQQQQRLMMQYQQQQQQQAQQAQIAAAAAEAQDAAPEPPSLLARLRLHLMEAMVRVMDGVRATGRGLLDLGLPVSELKKDFLAAHGHQLAAVAAACGTASVRTLLEQHCGDIVRLHSVGSAGAEVLVLTPASGFLENSTTMLADARAQMPQGANNGASTDGGDARQQQQQQQQQAPVQFLMQLPGGGILQQAALPGMLMQGTGGIMFANPNNAETPQAYLSSYSSYLGE